MQAAARQDSARARLVLLAALAALTLAGGFGFRAAPPKGAVPVAAAPVDLAEPWIPEARPMARYGLDAPEIAGAARRYEARRRRTEGGREDILSFNGFEDESLFLTLRLRRWGGETPAGGSLFVAAARAAAEDGMTVARLGRAKDSPGRFGPVETAEATLASAAGQRACLALRVEIAEGALTLSGFACGSNARPIDPSRLACLIDRLALLAPGEDRRIARAFAAAGRGSGCAAVRTAGETERRASSISARRD